MNEEGYEKAVAEIAKGADAKILYDAMIEEWERDGVDLSKTGVRQRDGGADNENNN